MQELTNALTGISINHRGYAFKQVTLFLQMISSHEPLSRSKCSLITLAHLLSNVSHYTDALESSQLGGLLVVVPSTLQNMNQASQLNWLESEATLMQITTNVPVYFIRSSESVMKIYDAVYSGAQVPTASFQDSIVHSIQGEFYHVSVSTSIGAIASPIVSVIEGSSFTPSETSLPTLVISAFYDSTSVVPALSYGGDSNASGLIVLLEIARILFRLRSQTSTPCKVNVVFVTSGGGKLNYWGTKKWIEEKLERQSESLLSDTVFTLSLESLGDRYNEKVLYMHTSREPKASSSSAAFFTALNSTGASQLITKKISLSDDFLSWEHERFASRRLPAFTISSLSHGKHVRSSIFDTCSSLNVDTLYHNSIRIAQSIATIVYGSSDVADKVASVASRDSIRAYVKFTCQSARSQVSLVTSNVGRPDFVSSLSDLLKKVTDSVTLYDFKMDRKSQSEFTLYEPIKATLYLYRAKSPLFEGLLLLCIAIYLALVYCIIKVSFICLFDHNLTNMSSLLLLPPLHCLFSPLVVVVQIHLLSTAEQVES